MARKHILADDIMKAHSLNIPIHVISAYSDELFGISESALEYEHVVELKGSYSSLLNKYVGHDTFWMHPKETAELIDGFIKHISFDRQHDQKC